MIDHLQPELRESEQRCGRPFDPKTLGDEVMDPATTHERRAYIGDYLGRIGDRRAGVGLRPDGLPDIVWLDVSGGEISLDGVGGTFRVDPFQISKYTVTWAQYRAFLEARDGYGNPECWEQLAQSGQPPGDQYRRIDNHPAENVSWYDAVAYCRWLSARLGPEVRLPAEWEWQQAATGGTADREFPWGAWDSRHANTAESGLNRTLAVGMYGQAGSPYGASDLSGNVWEWCRNEFSTPERIEVAGENPRVVRGGSFFYKREFARASYRDRDLPIWRNLGHGFRLLRLSAG
jgi:formylglycine-generating enzyme required for sulfatase activity